MGFLTNRRFTFRHDGGIGVTGVRYLLAQVAGYLLNLVLLLLLAGVESWQGYRRKALERV